MFRDSAQTGSKSTLETNQLIAKNATERAGFIIIESYNYYSRIVFDKSLLSCIKNVRGENT